MSVTVRAPAKINLHLGVGPVRDDGFHPLSTVYQAIGLYDDVTASDAPAWSVEVESDGRVDVADVPLDDTNLALRAGRLLAEHHGLDRAAALAVHKGIPVAGGLAGGSADAAAALVAVDRLWDLHTSDEELLDLAARLGSDVPFALLGGTAHGTGRGELVDPVVDAGAWWWVVVPSDTGLSTPQVYAAFDRLHADHPAPQPGLPEGLLSALLGGHCEELATELHNDLEPPALVLRPELVETRSLLAEAGAHRALLSGSGPTWLGLATDHAHAHEITERLLDAGVAPVLSAPGPVAGAHVVEYA